MVRQIGDGRPVAGGGDVEGQRVAVSRQRVAGGNRQRARETLVAIAADMRENDADHIAGLKGDGRPHRTVEARIAAVQRQPVRVRRQIVTPPRNRDMTAQSSSVSTHDAAIPARHRDECGIIGGADDDIAHPATFAGQRDPEQGRAAIDQFDGRAAAIGKHMALDRPAVRASGNDFAPYLARRRRGQQRDQRR